jgi:hypothetical protein
MLRVAIIMGRQLELDFEHDSDDDSDDYHVWASLRLALALRV